VRTTQQIREKNNMPVSFITCVCGENVCECAPFHTCSFCEQLVFDCCYAEQVEKYGVVGTDDLDIFGRKSIDQFGTGALKRCDNCYDVEKEPNLKP
jgi:hypothetical protein